MAPEKWQIPPPQNAEEGVRACFEEFVRRNEPENLCNREYTFQQFAQLCGRIEPDEDTINCARYLLAAGFFEVSYLFEDNHGELSETFSPKEILEAEKLGSLVDPQTGKELTDFRSRLFPFLTLSSSKCAGR